MRSGGLDRGLRQCGQDGFVDGLDGVVALLVVGVDVTLVGGDFAGGHVAPARLVFFAPQQHIEFVVRGDGGPGAAPRDRHRLVACRQPQDRVVILGDRAYVEFVQHRRLLVASPLLGSSLETCGT